MKYYKDNKIYDVNTDEWIEMPFHLKMFYKELDALCKKYNLSISHEDYYGAFEIKNYDEGYMERLMDANLCATINGLPEENFKRQGYGIHSPAKI